MFTEWELQVVQAQPLLLCCLRPDSHELVFGLGCGRVGVWLLFCSKRTDLLLCHTCGGLVGNGVDFFLGMGNDVDGSPNCGLFFLETGLVFHIKILVVKTQKIQEHL